MCALSANTPIKQDLGKFNTIPAAASATIYEGSMVGDSAGYGRALTAGDRFRGHAMDKVDNSSGSAGDLNIKVVTGRYRLQCTVTSVAITDAGRLVYASDDATLTLTPGTNTLVGKVVRYVTTNTAVVEFQTMDAEAEHNPIFGNVTGTDLAEVSGSFVDFAETISIPAAVSGELVAGDHIRIRGLVVFDDYNGTDTMDLKINIGDGTNTVLLVHTGDVQPAADNDYIRADIDLVVRTAGASGKIIWDAVVHTNLNGTIALKNCTVEDGVSLAGTTLITNAALTISAQGDYSASHADNEAQILWSVQIQKGSLQ